MEDEGDFAGCEELGLGWHAASEQGLAEVAVATDPTVEVAEGAGRGGGIGEVDKGKLGFAVGFYFHHSRCLVTSFKGFDRRIQ